MKPTSDGGARQRTFRGDELHHCFAFRDGGAVHHRVTEDTAQLAAEFSD